jgi:hypothetical protein
MLERHTRWRDSVPNAPVMDVAYQDVVDNEMDVVQRICRFCNLTPSTADERAMQAWSSSNGQHRQGEHKYSLEGTGLTDSEVLKVPIRDGQRILSIIILFNSPLLNFPTGVFGNGFSRNSTDFGTL